MPGFLNKLLARRAAGLVRAGAVWWMLSSCAAAERVSLDALQTLLGWSNRVVRPEWVDIGDGTNRIRLFPGLRRTEVNGVAVWLHDFAEPDGKQVVTFDPLDVTNVLQPVLRSAPPEYRRMRVMLDPGHGGEDGGAVSARHDVLEKNLVLDLALRIGRRLEDAGMTVAFTRRDDVGLTLDQRTATAAVWRADVLVSLHANFAANGEASGRETFVLPLAGFASTGTDKPVSSRVRAGNSNDVWNTLLGHCIHRHLPGRMHAADRGLRRARFQVLRQAPCPAALVEFGFLSNNREAKLLASHWYRDRLAQAVADGLLDYSRHLTSNPTNGFAKAAACPTNAVEIAEHETGEAGPGPGSTEPDMEVDIPEPERMPSEPDLTPGMVNDQPPGKEPAEEATPVVEPAEETMPVMGPDEEPAPGMEKVLKPAVPAPATEEIIPDRDPIDPIDPQTFDNSRCIDEDWVSSPEMRA